ncbi:hypothetical protein FGO68_gene16202 [Halteria grandinella]|uniref:Uncharacterized protein n=1 Tax=Halteria grandinella TaxID=5974 RepID=A0A8J8NEY8_HALGN|nr:hypothetical protein FGO68_gene16202 [Halteria grandinella]
MRGQLRICLNLQSGFLNSKRLVAMSAVLFDSKEEVNKLSEHLALNDRESKFNKLSLSINKTVSLQENEAKLTLSLSKILASLRMRILSMRKFIISASVCSFLKPIFMDRHCLHTLSITIDNVALLKVLCTDILGHSSIKNLILWLRFD